MKAKLNVAEEIYKGKEKMKLKRTKLIIEVRNKIRDCQKKGHVQQVAYSTYHDCLTQICFTCNEVLTNLYSEEDLK